MRTTERWQVERTWLQIKHQAETIAQLRAEVQQWKTQLARMEESSRLEIDGWKEQHKRAEHERSRLSARVDELLAGQLAVCLPTVSSFTMGFDQCFLLVERSRARLPPPIYAPHALR